MLQFLDSDKIQRIKKLYPKGTRIELISMDDPYAILSGTQGIVSYVDDIGQIHIDWETSESLAICLDVDVIRRVE